MILLPPCLEHLKSFPIVLKLKIHICMICLHLLLHSEPHSWAFFQFTGGAILLLSKWSTFDYPVPSRWNASPTLFTQTSVSLLFLLDLISITISLGKPSLTSQRVNSS